jgi:exonuclease SbcD
MPPVRILLLADTHLGFDLPVRPRVQRRRRGHDFQANYEAALAPALNRAVDVVVHGGDLFHRPRVPPSLAWQGLEPLVRVADAGVPVVLVPGNHERSRIPHVRFARHPRVLVLDRPRVVTLEVRGTRLRFVGFPFDRRVRERFPDLLRRTGWRPERGSTDLLCLHQCVEGATVGPSDFTLTDGPDVIRGRDIPAGFGAVLSGHIHRHQVLTEDLRGAPLPAPVLYPGSVERTSLAEREETKGFMVVEVATPGEVPPNGLSANDGCTGSVAPNGDRRPTRWRFHPLPARPMVVRDLRIEGLSATALDAALRAILRDAPPDAVLRIRTRGTPATDRAGRVLAAANLRSITPPGMNLEIRNAEARYEPRRPRARRPAQPELGL